MNTREERLKLFCNYMNGMAIGLFIAGLVTWPLAYIVQSGSRLDDLTLAGAVAIFLFGSVLLHLLGQFFLGME